MWKAWLLREGVQLSPGVPASTCIPPSTEPHPHPDIYLRALQLSRVFI